MIVNWAIYYKTTSLGEALKCSAYVPNVIRYASCSYYNYNYLWFKCKFIVYFRDSELGDVDYVDCHVHNCTPVQLSECRCLPGTM